MKFSTIRDIMDFSTRRRQEQVVASGLIVLFMQFFQWPLTSLLTVFVAPFVGIALEVLLSIVLLISLIHALRRPRSGPRWIPFATACLFTAISFWVPLSDFYMNANFHLLRSQREHIAEAILAPDSYHRFQQGRGGIVTLPVSSSYLSEDGEVDVDGKFVLFYTFRGVLSRFSGFVYSPTGEPPDRDQFGGDGFQIQKLAPHWFWYAS